MRKKCMTPLAWHNRVCLLTQTQVVYQSRILHSRFVDSSVLPSYEAATDQAF